MTNDTLQNVLRIAQAVLNQSMVNGIVREITPQLIIEQVNRAVDMIGGGTEEIRREVVTELIRRSSHWIGSERALIDNTNHEAWLTANLKRDWRYWGRYQTLLEGRMSIQTVEALDNTTDHILGLLENPARAGNWDRRGLVVGHVQSGVGA